MKTFWRRFELITADPNRIRAQENLLSAKHISRSELAIILLSLYVRPGIGEEAFDNELQDTQDSLANA